MLVIVREGVKNTNVIYPRNGTYDLCIFAIFLKADFVDIVPLRCKPSMVHLLYVIPNIKFCTYPVCYCQQRSSEVALLSDETVCLMHLLFIRFDYIIIQLYICICDAFGVCVCVCVYVWLYDNLKTIADICFLLGIWQKPRHYGAIEVLLLLLLVTQIREKSPTSLFVKVTGEGQGHSSEGSRSFGKVMSFFVAGSEIPSPMSSSSSCVLLQALTVCSRFVSFGSRL